MTRRRTRRVLAVAAGAVVVAVVAAGLRLRAYPWRNRCSDPRSSPPAATASAAPSTAAVSTSQPLATAVAADVLRTGGNAVDAALAAALMLAVAEPAHSGLGGGGFALVHTADGAVSALDFRERAPLHLDVAALRAAYADDADVVRDGALAVAVPAAWPGLVELQRRYATRSLAELAQPAIDAARAGVAIGRDHAGACWLRLAALRDDDDAARIFLNGAGLCPLQGSTLRQPELAATLAALTDATSPRSFDDVIGRHMLVHLASRGSAMSAADLGAGGAAGAVVERAVVDGTFRGQRIVSVGPPSAGGATVISLLRHYERLRLRDGDDGGGWLGAWLQASQLAFDERATRYGDPAFVAGGNTTHVSVVDGNGMAVALTLSLNTPFGAGIVVPGTGVLLNDEMGDFSYDADDDAANAPRGGKRPLSSMSPTFVFDADNQLRMVLGAPGGLTIPSAVAWVIRAVVEDGLDGESAVRAPRMHRHEVEPDFDVAALPAGARDDVERALLPLGRVQLVIRDSADNWRAVSDCRDDGAGWQGAAARYSGSAHR